MAIYQVEESKFVNSPTIANIVAQGNYSAYTIVRLEFDATTNTWTGTQTDGTSTNHMGTLAVIQKATTASDRNTWGIIYGETSIATDLSAVSNLDGGEALELAASGGVGLYTTATLRRVGYVTDETNDKIFFNGNGI